ncbi:hypothetical protein KUTeg_013559 [Tegillarca granosa]|uniref:Uncharacterized protein n=1 Tax=Tegillarca granosa TaxID=220873 RepID=A0ABQ9EZ72_TEGGR|nr:hypothetical protein KUTeg_013559 [Tegillarca granosa]
MNVATGCPLFVSHAVLETRKFIRDDTLFIKVQVDTRIDRIRSTFCICDIPDTTIYHFIYKSKILARTYKHK